MINNRRRLLLAVALFLAALSMWVYFASRTPARFEAIQPGMAVGELETVLGRPPDRILTLAKGHRVYGWQFDDDYFLLVSTEDDVVASKLYKRGPEWYEPFLHQFGNRFLRGWNRIVGFLR